MSGEKGHERRLDSDRESRITMNDQGNDCIMSIEVRQCHNVMDVSGLCLIGAIGHAS